MAEPFIGEIKLVPYNFAPRGWAFCDGTLISIAQNTALFALLGTMYGGNGQTTFALPDLKGRAALGVGQGPGLSPYDQGQEAGLETVTLSLAELPLHSHNFNVSSTAGSVAPPTDNFPATAAGNIGAAYADASNATMPNNAVGNAGGSLPHENHQPYLTLNYIIALQGIFPTRN